MTQYIAAREAGNTIIGTPGHPERRPGIAKRDGSGEYWARA